MQYKTKHIIEYSLLRLLQFLTCITPICVSAAILGGLYRFVFFIAWPKKEETCHRIKDVFGADLPIKQMRAIARNSLFNMSMSMIEMMRMHKISTSWIESNYTGVEETIEDLNQLIDRYGGVIIALPHAGNWELAGLVCMYYNVRLMAIARKQKNPLVDRWINANRQVNFDPIDTAAPSSYVRIAHHLKSGGVFAILPDVRGKDSKFTAAFLGREIPVNKGMARFARMSNVPIYPLVATRVNKTKHHIKGLNAVFPDMDANPEQDLLRMTQDVMHQFTHEIKTTPHQWFWYNRRWVLTPLGERTRK